MLSIKEVKAIELFKVTECHVFRCATTHLMAVSESANLHEASDIYTTAATVPQWMQTWLANTLVPTKLSNSVGQLQRSVLHYVYLTIVQYSLHWLMLIMTHMRAHTTAAAVRLTSNKPTAAPLEACV